jgi:DNA-binding NarL/FixJ family response regulator
MGDPVRVACCDDHPLIAELLSIVIDDTAGLVFVGDAFSGMDAAGLVADSAADVLVLDLDMPGGDGLSAIRAIRATNPDVQIIVYSGLVDRTARMAVTDAGANAVVHKDDSIADLEAALQAARRAVRPSGRFARAADLPGTGVANGAPALGSGAAPGNAA